MKEKLREQENVVFPAGKIVLLDEREIDCYLEYQKRFGEWRHQRNVELNPGKPLPPGW